MPVFPPLLEPGPELTAAERARFARQLILTDFGPESQRRVRAARVLVIGAGGLGSPVLMYLAAAGVGRITVVDDDRVEESNLHRQVIHGASALGEPKAHSAASRLADLAPLTEVVAVTDRLEPGTVLDLLADCDLVVDGSDNFATRYLVADACEMTGIPLVWGTLDRYQAQVAVFWSRPPAGYEPVGLRDVYPVPPAPGTVPSCGEAGILGALPGQIGSMLALQALWLITGVAEPLLGKLLLVDSRSASQRTLRVRPAPDRPRATSLTDFAPVATDCAVPDSSGAAAKSSVVEIGPRDLAAELAGGGGAGEPGSAPLLLDVREAGERAVAAIEPSLWIPLGDLGAGLDDPTSALSRAIAAGRQLVVYCKAGARSARAAASIAAAGGDVRSLAGGIDAWSEQVDPSLPRY